MSVEIWIAVCIVVILSLRWISPDLWKNLLFHRHPHFAVPVNKCSGPDCLPVIGNLHVLIGDNAEVWKTLRVLGHKYQPRYKIWAFNRAVINIMTPDDFEALLGNPKQISKSETYQLATPWLGDGLLTSGGSKWKSRRKLLTPAFHFNILKEFVKIFEENGNRAVELLDPECEKQSTNVTPIVTQFALQSICETTMGYKLDPKTKSAKNYKDAIYKFGEIVLTRMFRPWLFPDFLFHCTYLGYKARKHVKELHKFTSQIIHERLLNWNESSAKTLQTASGKKRQAMLNLMIENMKSGGDMDIQGLQEEVDTLMFEGHDTVSMGLTFFLLVLASHREIQDRIVEEVRNILDDTNRCATYEELQSMNYLEMCIKESLRLSPPVPFIARQLDEDLVLNDVTLPKGLYCHVQIYELHHNPKYWPDPDKFDPERFSPENCFGRHPYAYVPFSAGSRNCIGQRFAMLEMKSFISKILLKYILEPVDTMESVVILADLVLRPQGPVNVRFRKRE